MMDWTPPPPLACSLTPIHAPTPAIEEKKGVPGTQTDHGRGLGEMGLGEKGKGLEKSVQKLCRDRLRTGWRLRTVSIATELATTRSRKAVADGVLWVNSFTPDLAADGPLSL